MDHEETQALLEFLVKMMKDDGHGRFTVSFVRNGNNIDILNIEGLFGRRYLGSIDVATA